MKKLKNTLLIFLLFVGFFVNMTHATEPKGVIGRSYEDGFPVIWKFVNEKPTTSKRQKLPWLTVISWKYDGSGNNGMPPDNINDLMINLETALEKDVVKIDFCEHANSRTGNNLKEFVYYINNRDSFIENLNKALEKHPKYPIEINFYEDPEWKDFQRILNLFNDKDEQKN